jgi:HK97 family phage portal protein
LQINFGKFYIEFGRPKNEPSRQTSDGFSLLPFFYIGKRKQTIPKPNEAYLRQFAKTPVVRRCINLIKDSIVKREYRLKVLKEGNYDEQIAQVNNILQKPNIDDNYRTLINALLDDILIGDNGALEVVKAGTTLKPLRLFPVNGFTLEYVVNGGDIKYAQLIQSGLIGGNEYKYFTNEQIVMFIKNKSTNSPWGLSPVESAFNHINALTNTFEYSAEVASNATPKYALNLGKDAAQKLTEYRMYFENDCMGTPNVPLIASEKIESAQIAPISEEATFTNYQKFLISIIAIAFSIPPSKVTVEKANDRSTSLDRSDELELECLKPYAQVVEEGINKIIEVLGYGDILKFEYVWEESLDQKKKSADIVVQDFQSDCITVAEYRKLRGYPPLNSPYDNDLITVYKAKVNEEYGINGFGESKANNSKKDTKIKE